MRKLNVGVWRHCYYRHLGAQAAADPTRLCSHQVFTIKELTHHMYTGPRKNPSLTPPSHWANCRGVSSPQIWSLLSRTDSCIRGLVVIKYTPWVNTLPCFPAVRDYAGCPIKALLCTVILHNHRLLPLSLSVHGCMFASSWELNIPSLPVLGQFGILSHSSFQIFSPINCSPYKYWRDDLPSTLPYFILFKLPTFILYQSCALGLCQFTKE